MSWIVILGSSVGVIFLLIFILSGIRIIRPTHVGLFERLGKFKGFAQAGFHWIIPIVDQMVYVNITEQMVDVPPQMVITKDKLNAEVDAVVYYQVKAETADKSIYNVDDNRRQLTSLARTTLRAVIGKMTLTDANEGRDIINTKVEEVLEKETDSYGVHVLRVEIQKVEAPQDVQEAMNQVVKAEQEKIAAKDLAIAKETEADGDRMAAIKKAEGAKEAAVLRANGNKEAMILEADGEAVAIETVNKAADKYFVGNAQMLKKLSTVEKALQNNTKIVVPAGGSLVNLIGDFVGLSNESINDGSRKEVKKVVE